MWRVSYDYFDDKAYDAVTRGEIYFLFFRTSNGLMKPIYIGTKGAKVFGIRYGHLFPSDLCGVVECSRYQGCRNASLSIICSFVLRAF